MNNILKLTVQQYISQEFKTMISKHLAQNYSKITCLFSLVSLSILSYSLPARAHLTQPLGDQITRTSNLIAQRVPRNLDAPTTGRRRGGTSRRNGCPSLSKPLTALVPAAKFDEKTGKNIFSSSTISEFPSFWVYLPTLPKHITTGEFVLQNKEGKDIYRQNVKLLQKGGVMGIKLPNQPEYSLKNGRYRWYFSIFCANADKSSGYIHVDAFINRVAPDSSLLQQLEANKSEQYKVYKKNDLSNDAISNLAALRAASPNSSKLREDWKQLLTSWDLKELAEAPVVKTALTE
ncbi:MAG: DUF928 domain-containing protein [Rivularia sp. (in: cyanobacteria)]